MLHVCTACLVLLSLLLCVTGLDILCTDVEDSNSITLDMSLYQGQASDPSETLTLRLCNWTDARVTFKLANDVNLLIEDLTSSGGSLSFTNCNLSTIRIVRAFVTGAEDGFSVIGSSISSCNLSVVDSDIAASSRTVSFYAERVNRSSILVERSSVNVTASGSAQCKVLSVYADKDVFVEGSSFSAVSSILSAHCATSDHGSCMGLSVNGQAEVIDSNWTAIESNLTTACRSGAVCLGTAATSMASIAFYSSFFRALDCRIHAEAMGRSTSLGIVSYDSSRLVMESSFFYASNCTVRTLLPSYGKFASSMGISLSDKRSSASKTDVELVYSFFHAENCSISVDGGVMVASLGIVAPSVSLSSSYLYAYGCNVTGRGAESHVYVAVMGIVGSAPRSEIVLNSSHLKALHSQLSTGTNGGHYQSSFGVVATDSSVTILDTSYFYAQNCTISVIRGLGHSSSMGIAANHDSSITLLSSHFTAVDCRISISTLEWVCSSFGVAGSTASQFIIQASYFYAVNSTIRAASLTGKCAASMGLSFFENSNVEMKFSHFHAVNCTILSYGDTHVCSMGISMAKESVLNVNQSFFEASDSSIEVQGGGSLTALGIVSSSISLSTSFFSCIGCNVTGSATEAFSFLALMGVAGATKYSQILSNSSYFKAQNSTIAVGIGGAVHHQTSLGITATLNSQVVLNASCFYAFNCTVLTHGAHALVSSMSIVVDGSSSVSVLSSFFFAVGSSIKSEGGGSVSSFGILSADRSHVNIFSSFFYAVNCFVSSSTTASLAANMGIVTFTDSSINITSSGIYAQNSTVRATGTGSTTAYITSMGIVCQSGNPVTISSSYVYALNSTVSSRGDSKIVSVGIISLPGSPLFLFSVQLIAIHSHITADGDTGTAAISFRTNAPQGSVKATRFGVCRSVLQGSGGCYFGIINMPYDKTNISARWVHSAIYSSFSAACLATAPCLNDPPSLIYNMSFECYGVGWAPNNASNAYVEQTGDDSRFPSTRTADELRALVDNEGTDCAELLDAPVIELPEIPSWLEPEGEGTPEPNTLPPKAKSNTSAMSVSLTVNTSRTRSLSTSLSTSRSLNGSKSPSPSLSHNGTLTLIVAEENEQKGGGSAVSSMEAIMPVTAARAMSGSGSMAGVVGGLVSPGGASGAVRGNQMFKVVNCEYVEDIDESPAFFEHLIQVSIPSSEEPATLCVYLGSGLVTMILFVFLPFVTSHALRRWQSSRLTAATSAGTSSSNPVADGSSVVVTVPLEKLQRFFFSPLSSVCANYFLPCATNAATFVLFHASSPLFISLSLAILLPSLAMLCYLSYTILIVYPRRVAPLVGSKEKQAVYVRDVWLLGFGIWKDGSRDDDKWYIRGYILEDALAANVIAVLAGVRPGTGLCSAVAFVMLFFACAHATYVILVRPYRSRIETVFSILIALIQVLIAIVCCVLTFQDDDVASSFLGVLALLQNLGFVVQMGCLGFWSYYRVSARRHAREQDGSLDRPLNDVRSSSTAGAAGDGDPALSVPSLMSGYDRQLDEVGDPAPRRNPLDRSEV